MGAAAAAAWNVVAGVELSARLLSTRDPIFCGWGQETEWEVVSGVGSKLVWVGVQVRFDRADRGCLGSRCGVGYEPTSDTGNIMYFN